MNKSRKLLINKIDTFFELPKEEQREVLVHLYEERQLTWSKIADILGTYLNKVTRLANKLEIKFRTRSENQALALKTGRHKHPSKGGHKEETKVKISESTYENWKNKSQEERDRLKSIAVENWNNKSDKEIKEFSKELVILDKKASTKKISNKILNQDIFEVIDLLPQNS